MEVILGFLIGTAVGLTGVGAGSITAPALILLFGLTPTASVGTSLAFAALIKLFVAPVYLKQRQVDARILLLLCAGGIPGVLAGVYFLSTLNKGSHQREIYVLLGTTIAAISAANLYRSLRRRDTTRTVNHSRWLPPIAAVIGTEVGFSSAGAGALGALVLLNLTQLTPAQVVGTDMLFGLIVSLLGGGLHFLSGHYDGAILLKLVAGGIPGAFTGAGICSRVPPRPLKLTLSVCLLLLGVQLCWKGLF
jgi:uncharacterized membrane protein YfcA